MITIADSPFDDVHFPDLSDLPFRAGNPAGAIWGFYESLSGSPTVSDELGALNLLTPKRILEASKEIQTGKVVSLNWPLQKPYPAGLNRQSLQHRVFKWANGRRIIDDEIHINTQSGSQWDSFRHWGYYKTGQYYNGLNEEEIVDATGHGHSTLSAAPGRNGIHVFQGKIVGRGVLLDYFTYAQTQGITYNPNEQHLITADELTACAHSQGVTFRQGDILFVRMGFVHWYEHASEKEREETFLGPARSVGVRQSIDEVQWLWDHHFSAVAADSPAFEARPCIQEWNLHDYLLPLWGTPIGEMFDLEGLAQTCKDLGRYTFFLTSSPLNITNGIASPPNALAIF